MNSSTYTTDGKVKHFSAKKNINEILGEIIGEKFLNYRKLWDSVNEFELVTEYPLFLHLDMNQVCNYKCPQCIIGDDKAVSSYYEGDSLGWQDYTRLIDEASGYGCPSLSVQGNNEPLMIKDLERYITYAKERGFIDIMFNTNASLLTKERALSLLDTGVTRIRFSLDAVTPENYARIRVGGNYFRVVQNIENFLELKKDRGYKLPVTGVSFVVQERNYSEINAFKEFWSPKVDMVTFQNFLPPTPTQDYEDFYPPDEFYNPSEISNFRCVQPYQRVVVRNRIITPCCAMYSTILSLGSLDTTTVHQAWHSSLMNELREIHKEKRWLENKVCTTCINNTYPPSLRHLLEHKH